MMKQPARRKGRFYRATRTILRNAAPQLTKHSLAQLTMAVIAESIAVQDVAGNAYLMIP
jgi:hypothetical protein